MKIAIAAILGSTLLLASCDEQRSRESDGAKKETEATKRIMDQVAVVVGTPAIKNFTEKRQLKMLYELRDQANLATYTYYTDINGGLHKVCPTTSVGYGMPFSAQFTAPNVDEPYGNQYGYTTLSRNQPEPNGLYMPDSTSATWVICLGKDGSLKPVYVEPSIIVSLEPMVP